MPGVSDLLFAFSICDYCSADVRGGDAREGIKAVHRCGFDAASHYPAGLVEDRIYFATVAQSALWGAGIYAVVEKHKTSANVRSALG